MEHQNPQLSAEFEHKVQVIEQKVAGLENRFKEENFLHQKQLRQIEAGYREIQAERFSLNIIARDLAKLQSTAQQVYSRAVLILALVAATYAGYQAGEYVRLEHASTTIRSYDIETLSVLNRFWASLGDNELTVVIAFAGAVAAVTGFFAVWLSSHILKWLLVDYRPAVASPTATDSGQNNRDNSKKSPPDSD